jgi:hypothetical protein
MTMSTIPSTSYILLLLVLTIYYCIATTHALKLNKLKQGWIARGNQGVGNINEVSSVVHEGNIYSAVTVYASTSYFGEKNLTIPSSVDWTFALVKYSSNGECVWLQSPDFSVTLANSLSTQLLQHDNSLYLFVTVESGAFKVGNTQFTSTGGTSIIKYDTDGNVVWMVSHSASLFELLHTQIVTNDSLLYAVRCKDLSVDSVLKYDVKYTQALVVMRLGFNGTIRWVSGVDFSGSINKKFDVYKTSDDTFYMAALFSDTKMTKKLEVNGVTTNITTSGDDGSSVFVVGFNLSTGIMDFLESPKVGSVDQIQLYVFQSDIYLLGSFSRSTETSIKIIVDNMEYSNSNSEGDTDDIFLVKWKSNGTAVFLKGFGGDDDEYAHGLEVNSDGIFVIAASDSSFTVGTVTVTKSTTLLEDVTNYVVVKYNLDGTFVTAEVFIGGFEEEGYKFIYQTSDNGLLIGTQITDDDKGIVELRKLSNTGSLAWTFNATGMSYAYLAQFAKSTHGDEIYLALSFTTSITLPNDEEVTADSGIVFLTIDSDDGSIVTVSDTISSKSELTMNNLILKEDELYFVVTVGNTAAVNFGDTTLTANPNAYVVLYGIVSSKTEMCFSLVHKCGVCLDYTTCAKCVTNYSFTKDNQCNESVCYGVGALDNQVCSGRGHCFDTDKCCCPHGWAGHICSREKLDDPYYYDTCWKN